MSAPAVRRTCESSVNRLPATFLSRRKDRLYRWMLGGLVKQPLVTVSSPALQGIEGCIVPKGLRYIGSYNWVETPAPTVVVLG